MTRLLLGLAGAAILAQSVFALIAAFRSVEVPQWMLRNRMFYGHDHIPFVEVYTGFFYLAMMVGLNVGVVGLHSLRHKFRPWARGFFARVGVFGTLAVLVLRVTLFPIP